MISTSILEKANSDYTDRTCPQIWQSFSSINHISYDQLLSFYKQRGDEVDRLQTLIEQNRDEHQRSLRSAQHTIAQLEESIKSNELDMERFHDTLSRKESQLKIQAEETLNLNQTIQNKNNQLEQQNRSSLKKINKKIDLLTWFLKIFLH